MLIINADDYGLNKSTSENAISCYQKGRITSASSLMFMPYSERAARLAVDSNLNVGLHVNFTHIFENLPSSNRLSQCQRRISSFLKKNKYFLMIYNPLLKECFRDVFRAQYDEFLRIYQRAPTHFDGHHHMHLCANMLIDKLIPVGSRVRRNFTFCRQDKIFLNRLYRRIVDTYLKKMYICTDYFYSIYPIDQPNRIKQSIDRASSSVVELEVHPGHKDEYDYLTSDGFGNLIFGVRKGAFADLAN